MRYRFHFRKKKPSLLCRRNLLQYANFLLRTIVLVNAKMTLGYATIVYNNKIRYSSFRKRHKLENNQLNCLRYVNNRKLFCAVEVFQRYSKIVGNVLFFFFVVSSLIAIDQMGFLTKNIQSTPDAGKLS